MLQKSLKFSLFLLLLAATKANAQNVAINADGANPDASAMLDVQSTTSGVLIPRVTKTQRDAITNPATGLLIYQTDNESGFYYYQGVSSGGWVRLSTFAGGTNGLTGGWALNGNSGTGGSAFLGTTDPQDLVFKTQNMEVGRFKVNGNGSILLGRGSSIGTGQRTMVIGVDAKGNGSNNAVAIGYGAEVSLERATSLGSGAKAAGNDAIAIGTNAQAMSGERVMVFGHNANANKNDAVAIGTNAKVESYQGIAIGHNSKAIIGDQVVSVGNEAKGEGYQSIALGYNAQTGTNTDGSVAIGRGAKVNSGNPNSMALGSGAEASNHEAVAIGTNTKVYGYQSVALGKEALTGTGSNNSVAIGFQAKTADNVHNAVAIGSGAQANATNAIILGNNTAQVGIGTSSPNASAVLDINSSNKGVLVPRMTKGSRSGISSPADGLLIYQTDDTSGFYYYQGTNGWTRLANNSPGGAATTWSVSGNNFDDNNAFIGTTNDKDLVFKTHNMEVARFKINGNGSMLLGKGSSIGTGNRTMVIGVEAKGNNSNDAVAIGRSAEVLSERAAAFGNGAKASGNDAVAIGTNANATGVRSMVFGHSANAAGNDAVAIGTNAQAISGERVMVFGHSANANQNDAVAIGTNASSTALQGIAIGYNSKAIAGNDVVAIGTEAQSNSLQSLAIGYKAKTNTNSQGSVAIGRNAVVNDNIENAVALGNGAVANKSNAIILGNTSDAQVGIGTSTPANGVKLDVNGAAKLGASGSVLKNIITKSHDQSIIIPANSTYDMVIPLGITLSSPVRASVAISPSNELPNGVYIAWVKMHTTSEVKVRFVNTQGTPVNGFWSAYYLSITEF